MSVNINIYIYIYSTKSIETFTPDHQQWLNPLSSQKFIAGVADCCGPQEMFRQMPTVRLEPTVRSLAACPAEAVGLALDMRVWWVALTRDIGYIYYIYTYVDILYIQLRSIRINYDQLHIYIYIYIWLILGQSNMASISMENGSFKGRCLTYEPWRYSTANCGRTTGYDMTRVGEFGVSLLGRSVMTVLWPRWKQRKPAKSDDDVHM